MTYSLLTYQLYAVQFRNIVGIPQVFLFQNYLLV